MIVVFGLGEEDACAGILSSSLFFSSVGSSDSLDASFSFSTTDSAIIDGNVDDVDDCGFDDDCFSFSTSSVVVGCDTAVKLIYVYLLIFSYFSLAYRPEKSVLFFTPNVFCFCFYLFLFPLSYLRPNLHLLPLTLFLLVRLYFV